MGKYIIISKDLKGNQHGRLYKIKYTLRENPELRLSTHLYCMSVVDNTIRYCFVQGYDTPEISNKDRSEFIEEFYKFQKGGSYRRANPVQQTKLEELNSKRSKLLKELNEVNTTIKKVNKDKQNKLIESAYKKINQKKLDKFINQTIPIFTSQDYSIKASKWFGNDIITITDIKLNIPVAEVEFIKDTDKQRIEKYSLKQIQNKM